MVAVTRYTNGRHETDMDRKARGGRKPGSEFLDTLGVAQNESASAADTSGRRFVKQHRPDDGRAGQTHRVADDLVGSEGSGAVPELDGSDCGLSPFMAEDVENDGGDSGLESLDHLVQACRDAGINLIGMADDE